MRRGSWRRRTCVCCVVGLAACESGRADTGVLNLDDVRHLSFVEELRIGDVDDPELGFSSVGSADVDDEGRLYVVEAMELEIRVYDADGRELRRFGRRGEGPGEFVRAPAIGLIGDTLWALQRFPWLITLFTLDGRLLSTHRYEEVHVPLGGRSYTRVGPQFMGKDRHFVGYATVPYGDPADPEGARSTDSLFVPQIRFDVRGVVADTQGWYKWRPIEPWPEDYVSVGGQRYYRPWPLWDNRLSIPVPGSRIFVERSVADDSRRGIVTVKRIEFDGDTVYARAFEYRPVAYNDVVREELVARWARRPVVFLPDGRRGYRMNEPGSDTLRVQAALRAALELPAFQPPIHSHRTGNDGSLWLRREDTGDDFFRWLIFDDEGMPLGRLDLPRRLTVIWRRGDRFWGVLPDAQDVPWLVRYRITGRS